MSHPLFHVAPRSLAAEGAFRGYFRNSEAVLLIPRLPPFALGFKVLCVPLPSGNRFQRIPVRDRYPQAAIPGRLNAQKAVLLCGQFQHPPGRFGVTVIPRRSDGGEYHGVVWRFRGVGCLHRSVNLEFRGVKVGTGGFHLSDIGSLEDLPDVLQGASPNTRKSTATPGLQCFGAAKQKGGLAGFYYTEGGGQSQAFRRIFTQR